MGNLNYKYQNFNNALARLSEVCELYDGEDSIVRDSVIQRFEFTYTVTVSFLKEYFEQQGIVLENSFPKYIMRIAYSNKIIDDDKGWLTLISDRNLTSHIYNEGIATEIARRIVSLHLPLFMSLNKKLEYNI